MVSVDAALTIALMGLATYSTRLIGFLAVSRLVLNTRATRVMEVAPGCVLITVIAPRFVTGDMGELLALAITVLAAIRFSLLSTVMISVISTGLLRHLLG
ncbi:AzlD family protein [Salinicola lusitanus]|uniref:AzlD family protein n=1 Tax=Salinicola lusitanus TaxID=1949085 RepID=A0ABZ3CSM6_9GAMM